MIDTSEKNFEATIEASLLNSGYQRRSSKDYERSLCLIPEDVLNFIQTSQPQEWQKFQTQYGDDANTQLLKQLAEVIKNRGTLEVLRKGIKANSCRFQLAYFQPPSSLNPETQRLYQTNCFSVLRQLYYSQKNPLNSIDIVLFLNGLPIFTAELKNPFTGQNFQQAIKQYQEDRDPREPLLKFGVCLSHFAVDPDQVHVTTHLQGHETGFLPFNPGKTGVAANPDPTKFRSAYLWEQIWRQDSFLDLIQNFITLQEKKDDKDRKTGVKSLIFPRYHQLDAVRRLLADAKAEGTGKSYLIQHSAGSGKSNSIAWLAHGLVSLYDDHNSRVFDSIIVITDRRILDQQLQATIRQFEQTSGVVENIDKTSRQLKEALESGKNIIVTTLQKFSVIVDQIQSLSGQRFAVIVDEAHSSQTGESTKKLKSVLTATSLEAAAAEEGGEEEDLEDRIVSEAKKRGKIANLSYFAFTATPKPKTLEVFGTRQPDGSFAPFSLYSMAQAIEESFILDVLENYTTYKTYFNLLKTIEDDPHYDRARTASLLRHFVDLHEHTIKQKVAIIVEHFHEQVAHQVQGKAKAMIITRSRLHAVRYKLALDRYLKEKDYPYQSLVAFTGTVRDGEDFTETKMNSASSGTHIPDKATADTFQQAPYRFLVVANKFQTGFDQPLLGAMYIDKKLAGVNAVQTLSRLNRIHPHKTGTLVLDFANEADEIEAAFKDYYDCTILTEATDPNRLYKIQAQLDDYHFYQDSDIDSFAQIFFHPQGTQAKLHGSLDPVLDRYLEASEEEKVGFRGKLQEFIRLYGFVSQLLPIPAADLEKFYEFCRHLICKLPTSPEALPLPIQQSIELNSYRIQETHRGKIELKRGVRETSRVYSLGTGQPPTKKIEPLSKIIEEINRRFGTDFSEDERVFIEHLETKLDDSAPLKASLKINTPENVKLAFDILASDIMQDMVEINFSFYKKFTDDLEFKALLLGFLFNRFLQRSNTSEAKTDSV
ncbi:Type I restriction-modification system, restriction subunit R [Microcystis aeruginosa NIES-2481]|uniref:type I restriction endonuclease subunit R n=1 Tax=Microcystis aeruginosa TaxID=1126 RepID=UPI00081F82B3|nr:DEAD/DEAH box helicase family protein [Microcystis aeruginosa]AOC52416.1 Type I restriction-modification system, restriction subunit R [Microcystis aeruginosa NIES-2481]